MGQADVDIFGTPLKISLLVIFPKHSDEKEPHNPGRTEPWGRILF
jgi:hypothetical protein